MPKQTFNRGAIITRARIVAKIKRDLRSGEFADSGTEYKRYLLRWLGKQVARNKSRKGGL